MIVGVPKETYPDEHRVALIPPSVAMLRKKDFGVFVEAGAGEAAGFTDPEYEAQGARLTSREEIFAKADVVLQVRSAGANPEAGRADLELLREGQILIALLEPLRTKAGLETLATKGVTAFSLELVPRITRAQTMDTLSSQANLAGYKAVLVAAARLNKIFPMMMTAAGTIAPARVFVVGAGVAGLQAIATAKRMGAKVSGFDVRAVVKEQVESLGAKFVELGIETEDLQDKGGYAKEQSEEFIRKQREMMKAVCSESDVVITTALVPGKRAPVLINRDMVEAMPHGSILVDLAAAGGGNCELTKPGEEVVHGGVTILGPVNAPSDVAHHASQMFSKNIATFLMNMVDKEEGFQVNLDDEIVADTLVTRGGKIVNARVREVHGLPPLEPPAPPPEEAPPPPEEEAPAPPPTESDSTEESES